MNEEYQVCRLHPPIGMDSTLHHSVLMRWVKSREGNLYVLSRKCNNRRLMQPLNILKTIMFGLIIFSAITLNQSEGRSVTLDYSSDTYRATVGNLTEGNRYDISFKLPPSLCQRLDIPQCAVEEYYDADNPISASGAIKWSIKITREKDNQNNPDAITIELTEYSNININKEYDLKYSINNKHIIGFNDEGEMQDIPIGDVKGKIQFGKFSNVNELNKIEASKACYYPRIPNTKCMIILKIPNNESINMLKNFSVTYAN